MLFHPFDKEHYTESYTEPFTENLTIKPKINAPKITAGRGSIGEGASGAKSLGNRYSAANRLTSAPKPPPPKFAPSLQKKIDAQKLPVAKPQVVDTPQVKQTIETKTTNIVEDAKTPGKVETSVKNGEYGDEVKQTQKDIDDGKKVVNESEAKPLLERIKESGANTFESAKSAWKNNWKTVVGVGAGLAVLAMLIHAKVLEDKINSTDYKILSIVNDTSDNSLLNVFYEPTDEFAIQDQIIISNTDCEPIKNGSYEVQEALPGMVSIKTTSKLTKDGTTGNIKVFTDFSNQFGKTVNDAVEPVTDAAGSVIDSTSQTFFDTVGKVLGNAVPDSIKNFFSDFWWIILIVSVLSVFSSISAAMGIFIYKK